jgi:hypothetical protein
MRLRDKNVQTYWWVGSQRLNVRIVFYINNTVSDATGKQSGIARKLARRVVIYRTAGDR